MGLNPGRIISIRPRAQRTSTSWILNKYLRIVNSGGYPSSQQKIEIALKTFYNTTGLGLEACPPPFLRGKGP